MSVLYWVTLFANLTEREASELALFCQERYVKSWEVLFNEWDEATAMYIVKEWKLKAYRVRPDWDQVLGYIHKDEFVWEMAFFDGNDIPKKNGISKGYRRFSSADNHELFYNGPCEETKGYFW